jgi:hypothetical protein
MSYLRAATRAALGLTAAVLFASPVHAQFRARPISNPAPGEQFHVEASVNTWNPSADLSIVSGGTGSLTGIAGTEIDARADLGFVDKRLPQFNLTLRPGGGHKLRLQYIPINYSATATLTRNIDFNGQRYAAGLPVTSSMEWKAYRFGYEFDFIRKDHGFAGFITELKYTDINVELASGATTEFAHKRAPIPALGGVGRVYVIPPLAITGEVTAFKLPTVEDRYSGHYVDVDVYGTLNLTANVGVQGGYRSLNLGYLIKEDSGTFVLKGIYFGVVARF